MKVLDINTWNRREHFDFFSQFDEPFLGLVSEIDCTIAYKLAKENNYSFFAYYLHKSLIAVNDIEEFRYRIVESKIVIFEEIHSTVTIGRDDGTFGFSFEAFTLDFKEFALSLKKEIVEVRNSDGIRFNEDAKRADVVHYSTIPWNMFTGLSHPRNFKMKDSVPKITFGKIFMREGKWIMPISINAHHGLIDGLHVAKYLELFQKLMNESN